MTSLIQPVPNYQNIACVAPFSALFIHSTNKVSPCCAYNFRKTIDLVDSQDLIWNFENSNKLIRQEFIEKGFDISKYDNCSNCAERGHGGQNNIFNREVNEDIDYISNPTLTNLHLKFSNQCNLACRICASGCSNLIFDEDGLLGNRRPMMPRIVEKLNNDSVLNKSIFNHLDKLNFLWFSGGEPLLHNEVWELLSAAYKKGYSKNIKLKFNTNGTIKLSKEQYNILKSFKSVDMEISMDGIEKHAEYIRTNVSWDRWLYNLKEYQNEFSNHANLNLYIITTVSVFNVHILNEIKDFFTKLNIYASLGYVTDPHELCVYNINQTAKDYLNIKYQKLKGKGYKELLDFINLQPVINCEDVIKYVDKKDDTVINNNLYKNYRAFRDVDPEWHAMLKG